MNTVLAGHPPETDGRIARSARSKAAVVDAFLELLREGRTRPSTTEIAERAGVTQRTLFNLFGDVRSLLAAVVSRHFDRIQTLMPPTPAGSYEDRLAEYVPGLADLLEDIAPVRWAAVTAREEAPQLVAALKAGNSLVRGSLAAAFAEELSLLDPERRDLVLNALLSAADPVTWRTLRNRQGLSRQEAGEVLLYSIDALVRAG